MIYSIRFKQGESTKEEDLMLFHLRETSHTHTHTHRINISNTNTTFLMELINQSCDSLSLSRPHPPPMTPPSIIIIGPSDCCADTVVSTEVLSEWLLAKLTFPWAPCPPPPTHTHTHLTSVSVLTLSHDLPVLLVCV